MNFDYNDQHRELLPGEVWVTNASFPEEESLGEIPLEKTLPFPCRAGTVAFDKEGNRCPDVYPIFALKKDIIAAGKNPDDLFPGQEEWLDQICGAGEE